MSSLDSMKKRVLWTGRGGDTRDDRIVSGKYRSFLSSLKDSYQGEWITFNDKRYRCLINPDKLSEEYDQKEISIDFDAGMTGGDVFFWDRTNSYWLVYLPHLEEEAYFRASIRQCKYQINGWWVWLRGPVETALVWNQKHDIYFNDLNLSILIYVAKTEETMEFFKRFQIIKFDGHNWRVAATDRYSQEGIIEVYLEEYNDNDMEDAVIAPEIIEPDTTKPYISGPQFVKPYDTDVTFSIVGAEGGAFVISNKNKAKVTSLTDTSCTVDILTGKSGNFDISYRVDGTDIITWSVTIQSI